MIGMLQDFQECAGNIGNLSGITETMAIWLIVDMNAEVEIVFLYTCVKDTSIIVLYEKYVSFLQNLLLHSILPTNGQIYKLLEFQRKILY